MILAGLMGAIIWNLITWYFGLPTSSSHALFGGYGGAAVAKAGFGAIIVSGWTKTLIFIVVAPLIGLDGGPARDDDDLSACSTTSTPARVDRWFRRFQLVSAAAYSLMHGANDAQKTMGIITGALRDRRLSHDVRSAVLGDPRRARRDRPRHAVAAAGASSRRWGTKITKLQPAGGFAAETGAAVAIFTATHLGIGISTTHTITGAIVGVGATQRLSRRALGRGRSDRLGLAPHDSGVGDDRRPDVLSRSISSISFARAEGLRHSCRAEPSDRPCALAIVAAAQAAGSATVEHRAAAVDDSRP